LFIDASGNVGVGIAAPEGVFDINRVADGDIGPILNIRNATATGTSNTKGEIRFHQRDAVSNARYSAIGAGCADTFSRDGYLYFSTNAGTSAPTERMRLDSSGRLGLGTSNAQNRLHVQQDATDVNPCRISNTTVSGAVRAAVEFGIDTGVAGYIGAHSSGSGASLGGGYTEAVTLLGNKANGVCIVASNASGKFSVFTGSTASANERLRIDSQGRVGIGTTSPSASALLDVSSTTQGLLPPRMTGVQRDAISSPAAGLMIYNTTTNKLNFYNGTAWEAVTSA
jgi:hypothetical protein